MKATFDDRHNHKMLFSDEVIQPSYDEEDVEESSDQGQDCDTIVPIFDVEASIFRGEDVEEDYNQTQYCDQDVRSFDEEQGYDDVFIFDESMSGVLDYDEVNVHKYEEEVDDCEYGSIPILDHYDDADDLVESEGALEDDESFVDEASFALTLLPMKVLMDCQLFSVNWTKYLCKSYHHQTRHLKIIGGQRYMQHRFSNLRAGSSHNTIRCSMKSYRLSELTQAEVDSLKARPRIDFSSIFNLVNPIVDDVRCRGDAAVKDYTAKFDKVELDKIVDTVGELPDPELDAAIREAFDVAYQNIYAFHVAQKSAERSVENMKGVEKIFGPGNQYVTAAKMILQNSEAMISIDMPAGPSEVLVIADKHANPIHIASDLLSQENLKESSDIQNLCNPLGVLCCCFNRREGVAHYQLVFRAEHGPDSQVVLVIAGDGVDIRAIEEEISKQCKSLPRGEFASKALGHSFTVFARDMVEAISFSNLYAPEHLIINVQDAEKWESFIENAGSVFLGEWTPESVGDYASGTNHVLPTYGYARMYGGVSLDSFLKYMTVQSLTEEGLMKLGPYVATMAEVEGLEAHKRAVTLRLQEIEARRISQMR
ncbi:unnamed protein product [Camellia sinensis]